MSSKKDKQNTGATIPDNDFWASILNETMLEEGKRLDGDSPSDGGGTQSEPQNADGGTIADCMAAPAPEPPMIRRGETLLNTYRVESDMIGGGMGAVWKVHHEGWNTDLAMKRPRPVFFQTEQQKENFTRECESWITLGLHPNIVSCYYVREIDGVPTIFSEWMENGDLEKHIKYRSLYAGSDAEVRERLLDIAIQFARGLCYAHENHLVHQDVKPDNLLLTNTWEAKVSDFGIARARSLLTVLEGEWTLREADSNATQMAPGGGRTPAYCSPEQAAGQLLTKRTDLYSWAVSVLEMYLGYKPWAHPGELTGPVAGLVCRDYFDMCTERPIPKALRELLARCLAQNPDDRPHDFKEVEAELLDIYRTETGAAYPRPEPRAAADTAESLNNRAMSYLDLGKPEEAERLWQQALEKDRSVFLYHYNLALLRWNRHEISDAAFVAYLKQYEDNSALCQSTMEKVLRMRGFWDAGKVEYTYQESAYSDKDLRPDRLEALLPPARTSTDGGYAVEGYVERRPYGYERYGYRITDLHTGESREYPNDYDDYGISDPVGNFTYLHPHHFKSTEAFFVGPHSEIVVMVADVLWFFDAKSGRLLLSLPPVVDEDGDTWFYRVLGYTESGVIEYSNTVVSAIYSCVTGIRLHPEERLSCELAVLATVNDRLEAEASAERNYKEALACWVRGDRYGTWRALNKSLENQVLTMHEPSLRLWSELGAYYPRGSLVTVLPTLDEPTPLPERFARRKEQAFSMTKAYQNHSDDGQTELCLDYVEKVEFDWCMDMNEYTCYYNLTARDLRSGKTYFEVHDLEIADEADWQPFSNDRYLGLQGEDTLWYAGEYVGEKTIDLRQEPGLRFALPGGCFLKNTKNGVDIGGFVFDDVFADFRPLWDADVIACRNHNYRLVYHYLVENT